MPGYANPQHLNRYSYVLNNPIKLTDPSGHICVGESVECLNDDGSPGAGFTGGSGNGTSNKPNTNKGCGGPGQKSCLGKSKPGRPILHEFGGVIVAFMPPGSNPSVPRSNWALRLGTSLGIAGFAFDIGEMIGIFNPDIGGEDVTALGDIGVTYVASLLSGQSYFFEQPHSDLPAMVSVNQDVLVTTGDAAIALGGKGIGALVGGLPGYGVGLGIDVATTGTSLVYDYNRVFGSTPNYISAGVSVSSNSFGKGVIILWP